MCGKVVDYPAVCGIVADIGGEEMEKTCTFCKRTKPLEMFSRDRRQRMGRRPDCKICESMKPGRIVKNARIRARVRGGIVFSITKEDVQSIPNACHFCCKEIDGGLVLHRIVPDSGYVPGNVVKAHKKCHMEYHASVRERDKYGRFV